MFALLRAHQRTKPKTRMKTHLTKALLLVAVALTVPTLAVAALINGSFEEPFVASNLNFTGAFSFNGWSAFSTGTGGDGNAGIVFGTDYGLTPFDGNQHFSFNGGNPPPGSYIEQTFSTVPGVSYTVAFGIGRNSAFLDPQQSLAALELISQVFNQTGDLLNFLPAQPSVSIAYTPTSFSFVANSATSRLRFTDVSASNPNTDLFIDSVSVVPEPTAALLTIFGLVIVATHRSRLRRPPQSLLGSLAA